MPRKCYHCGLWVKNLQALRAHLQRCPILQLKRLGILPGEFGGWDLWEQYDKIEAYKRKKEEEELNEIDSDA